MNSFRPEFFRRPGPGSLFACISLFVAVVWLISHVWFGLDFTDEMQYYGEISGLTRSGRFFQNDLFIQQLGYLFVVPFFKLHALIFPDQSYLILFGRLLLLAGYGAVGAFFWLTASRSGRFSTGQKLAGLAAFFSWVPFQIFAFSYNSTSYLLIVALVAVWVDRDASSHLFHVVKVSVLLVMLAFTYPPAGLVFIPATIAEMAARRGWRDALSLLAAIVAFSLVAGGVILAFHGPGFWQDLAVAVQFSRAFSAGDTIKAPGQFSSCLTLVAAHAIFILRVWLGRPFRFPFGAGCPTMLRWASLAVIVSAGSILIGLVVGGGGGFPAVSICFGLLMFLAASAGQSENGAPASPAPFQRAMIAVLILGGISLLALGLGGETGFFATTVLMMLLIILAVCSQPENKRASATLAGVAAVTGSVYSFASSNGVHNFGVGAAGVIPFLVLHCLHEAGLAKSGKTSRLIGQLAPPALVFLLVLNGVLHPYREIFCWNHFEPINGVPAFQGIRSSAVKAEAIRRFTQTTGSAELRGKRMLVAGPHPWLYFALGGEPATAMMFMHYSGREAAYGLVAARMGRNNPPDVILLTLTTLPRPVAAQINRWQGQAYRTQIISLPPEFIQRYAQQTDYELSTEVILLRR